jgi:putative ABC transport system ATP-binding protein
VLLADEPTSELDRSTRDVVMDLLRERADAGAIVVVATHDPEIAERCDDHHRMDEGRVLTGQHRW